MRVFVTGATGYIGHAVAKSFRMAGHEVFGLVRSENKANLLRQCEIEPVIGDLANPNSLVPILNEVQVVVHCGFDTSEQAVKHEAATLDTILSTYSDSPIPHSVIYTSGVWVYGNTHNKTVDEATALNPLPLIKWRPIHEQKVLQANNHQLRTIVIRPGTVYGGTKGIPTNWFASAQTGKIIIVGDGQNHWSMVHIYDLARGYVLAAEKELRGVAINLTDDSSPTVLEMAYASAEAAGIPGKIQNLTKQEGERIFGPFVQGLLIDQTVSNERAKRLLRWFPRYRGFIGDTERYFQAWKAAQNELASV